MWNAVGGKKGLAIAGATAVALAAAGFGIVRLFTPAHPVSVTFTSDTPGATVSAGGATCVTPNCRLELRPGTYTLTAQRDGYKAISQPLTISATDRDLKVPLTFEALPPAASSRTTPAPPAPTPETNKQPEPPPAAPAVPATGVLEIAGALPQAAVTVDGRLAGVTDGRGRLRTDVAPGRHSIEISKDGYQPARFEARFTAGGAPTRPSSAQIAMAKLPPPAAPTPAPVPPPAAPKASEPKPVDTEAQDWARVANSGRIQDLQDYLRKHPGGAHERDAQGQIAQIQQAEAARADQAAWDGVDKGNKTALQDFIARHGSSAHLPDARNLLDGIQKREAADAAAAELKKRTDQEKSTKAAEAQAVVRTLTEYEAAFNRMDLPTMERLYNPMPAALREQFRGFKSVSFQLKPTDTPAVNGDTATVTCTRSQTAVAKQGGRFATPSERVQVKLVRTGSGWIIREITRI
jgi:hypothetical protein